MISDRAIQENKSLVAKAQLELRISVDALKNPIELVSECITELMDKGFLRRLSTDQQETLYQIHDLKNKLALFITTKLRESGEQTHFEKINLMIKQAFGGFFKKEMVFNVIDQLF